MSFDRYTSNGTERELQCGQCADFISGFCHGSSEDSSLKNRNESAIACDEYDEYDE